MSEYDFSEPNVGDFVFCVNYDMRRPIEIKYLKLLSKQNPTYWAFVDIGKSPNQVFKDINLAYEAVKACITNHFIELPESYQKADLGDLLVGYIIDLPKRLHPTNPANLKIEPDYEAFNLYMEVLDKSFKELKERIKYTAN